MQKDIQLPKHIREFEETTLILQITNYHSRVMLGHRDHIKIMDSWICEELENQKYSDNEGHSKTDHLSGFANTSRENNHNKEHDEKHYCNFLAEKIHFFYNQGTFDRLILFLPAHMHKVLEHKLDKHILENIHFVHGTFNYDSPIQLVERLYVLK